MKKHVSAYQVGLVTLAVAAVFLYWIFSVVFPIVGVELSYQFKKNIRPLVWPQFRTNISPFEHTTDGIAIPAIFVDEPVIYNVDPNNKPAYLSALRKGIAHASGTAFPGVEGLGYYFAHSSTPDLVLQYNAVFYLLGKLRPGDDIFIWHAADRFNYKVTDTNITSPYDLSFLQQRYSAETIVLQTCWPPGTTLERLLVFARRTQ